MDGDPPYRIEPSRHTGWKRNGLDREGLQTLLDYDDQFFGRDPLAAILVAAGYKEGAFVRGFFEEEQEAEEFVETLNMMGVTCGVQRYHEDGDEVYDILLSRGTQASSTIDSLFQLRKEDRTQFQQELGLFLGYPEQDVESFMEGQTARYIDTSGYLDASPEQDRESYRMDDEDRRLTLTFHAPSLDRESLADMDRRAATRYRALEAIEDAYDIPVTDRVEHHAWRRQDDTWLMDEEKIGWVHEFTRLYREHSEEDSEENGDRSGSK